MCATESIDKAAALPGGWTLDSVVADCASPPMEDPNFDETAEESETEEMADADSRH